MDKLQFISIAPAAISNGGYTFVNKVTVPAGGQLFLCIENATNRVDITGGYNKSKMPALFRCMEAVDGWGTSKRCWLVLEKDGKPAGESDARDINCPVKPYDGAFTIAGFSSALPKLTYPGSRIGRFLSEAIDGKYYFRFGSMLETNNTMRGFDCTTFIMSLFQCYPDMTDKYGTYLVEKLGCTKCDMEQKKEKDIKAFYADAKKGGIGNYIMWSEGHMLVAKNAVLHEFTNGGYAQTAAASFARYNKAVNGLWWIRKLPASYTP